MPDLKIAIVTDIHHGEVKLTKRGDRALDLLENFLDFCADYGPDLIADLGDRINDKDRETDRRRLAEVAAKFRGLNTPHVHLDGNHDSDFLLPSDNANAVGSGRHESRDVNGYHLVFWNASTKIPRPEPFRASDDDLAWLARDLTETDLPTIVFSHVPFGGASVVGNYWFQNTPDHATYPNAAEIRKLVEASDRVVLCVAGQRPLELVAPRQRHFIHHHPVPDRKLHDRRRARRGLGNAGDLQRPNPLAHLWLRPDRGRVAHSPPGRKMDDMPATTADAAPPLPDMRTVWLRMTFPLVSPMMRLCWSKYIGTL